MGRKGRARRGEGSRAEGTEGDGAKRGAKFCTAEVYKTSVRHRNTATFYQVNPFSNIPSGFFCAQLVRKTSSGRGREIRETSGGHAGGGRYNGGGARRGGDEDPERARRRRMDERRGGFGKSEAAKTRRWNGGAGMLAGVAEVMGLVGPVELVKVAEVVGLVGLAEAGEAMGWRGWWGRRIRGGAEHSKLALYASSSSR